MLSANTSMWWTYLLCFWSYGLQGPSHNSGWGMFHGLHSAWLPKPFYQLLALSLSFTYNWSEGKLLTPDIFFGPVDWNDTMSQSTPFLHLSPLPVSLPRLDSHIALPMPSYPPLWFFLMEILFIPHWEAVSAASDSESIPLTSHKLHYVVSRELIICSDVRRRLIYLVLWVFPYISCVWYHRLHVCRVRSINQTINMLHYVYHFGESVITETIQARFWILQLMTMDVCPWTITVYIHQKGSLPSFW